MYMWCEVRKNSPSPGTFKIPRPSKHVYAQSPPGVSNGAMTHKLANCAVESESV
jgi:hypothetical protein